ncbi:Accessory gland-specific peptide 57Dc [Bienertia sinuspersici]
MIISHPSPRNSPTKIPFSRSKPPEPSDTDSPESYPSQELSFEDWVDKKLTQNEQERMNKMNDSASLSNDDTTNFVGMDKSKRKYYNKRSKRMYGSDSDDERRKMREKGEIVELKPEIVELRTLHKREEELYFYDTFALPWEKDKHYKMVYQLEKKYFPDQCLDKAFLESGQSNSSNLKKKKKVEKGEEDKGLIFFEEGSDGRSNEANRVGKDGVGDISEKKVEEFFKCLKKVPHKNDKVSGVNEPFLASRSSGLPPKWDSPAGTVVLVNKPKGET